MVDESVENEKLVSHDYTCKSFNINTKQSPPSSFHSIFTVGQQEDNHSFDKFSTSYIIHEAFVGVLYSAVYTVQVLASRLRFVY